MPLKDINIVSHIHGFIAHVETTYVYENEGDDPIEAIFVFPMDDSSAVYKFEAVIEGRLIVGEVQSKEQVCANLYLYLYLLTLQSNMHKARFHRVTQVL